MQEQGLPLNDPAITMLPTQQAPLLELIDTLDTLRCTWGSPGSVGLSTSISVVDPSQAAEVLEALTEAGLGCEDAAGATICHIEQRGVSLENEEFTRGETHAVEGDVWVATSWLNVEPDGYTEDILATVHG